MPLRIVPPRKGKTPNYAVRGTYLGQYVDRTAGTPDRAKAKQALRAIERQIERGAFSDRSGPTFASAALSYVRATGNKRFLGPLSDHFKERSLDQIDQEAIDEAAHQLYPTASPATRNRQVYTPISAILKHAGIDGKLKRPKGAEGNKKTNWLRPDEVFRIFEKAEEMNRDFAALLVLLCYTGLRRGEALKMLWRDVHLSENFAFVGKTKNGDPRPVHLPPPAVAALANLEQTGARVFGFAAGGHLYAMLRAAFFRAGVDLGERDGFHLFRHTWATWMRRYGGLDVRGLAGTGAWSDEKSAGRYAHVVTSEEARKADLLPTRKRARQ